SLCLVIGQVGEKAITVKFSPRVFINNKKQSIGNRKVYEFMIATDHILLFDISLLKFEDNEDVVFSDNNWNYVVFSYVDHISNNGVPIKVAAKCSGIHVSQQRSAMEDIQFTNPLPSLLSGNLYPNSMETHKRVQITEDRLQKETTKVLSSPILSSSQLQPPIAEVRKGPGSKPILPVKRSLEDVTGETSKRLRDEEVHPITIPSDPPVFQSYFEESSEHESGEYSSKTASEGSDSDPFDRVDRRLSINEEETISSASSSGDASLGSIREAINSLEPLMAKELSEVSSDPDTHSGIHQLLDLLSTSNHPKLTVEVKEAIEEFKRKTLLSFQEFQSTVESVNKLKDFERHLAKIQEEALEGKGRRKDLK
ncbi:TMV resistance protein N-like, partial [Trifolium medium]|nr:TMV resistance protein N-like [Trifolium medium]